jgi:hypothetical protein
MMDDPRDMRDMRDTRDMRDMRDPRDLNGGGMNSATRRNTTASVASSAFAPGERLKIKCHYTDTRIILVPVDITFNDLQYRIQKKFNAGGVLKLKYKDSDDEMVLMTDQEDLEIALEMNGIEYGVIGGANDKMELWCYL